MTRFEVELGLRYVRARRRNGFISFISLVSMLGIALGVAALIIVLSVMNGFQSELRSRMLAALAHVEVKGFDGPLVDWRRVEPQLRMHPAVRATAPYVQLEGLWINGEVNKPSLIRGIDPIRELDISNVHRHMRVGTFADLRPGEWGVILGVDLARALGVRVGEKVALVTPQGTVTPAGSIPRLKSFTVVGLFELGWIEADSRVALIHLEDAQRLYQLGDAVTGLRVALHDLMRAPEVARTWVHTLPPGLGISDWTQQNANFFKAVELEKRVMWVILTLIVAVAAFNLVSTLVMVVTDKQADIAILRTLGASAGSVMLVFFVQGMLIGLMGTAIGAVVGLAVALNLDQVVGAIERLFNVTFIDKTVYLITELPSRVLASDVLAIVGTSIGLSLLATLYPSWRASQVNPAEALRYE
ncbi:MAG: lipoprotein-releasing ABC transporter permease subunit [Casimicrobiaceae bacterium]|nr:lipoprotein-releasing ABC transporter permease subunit [Casimicrobiaceae bacterium]MCX8098917.1 lipoprotein-releasing ABC transporter permease subunit [Casimicrobiaceae bacterium]MDW8312931.1 lipoprotein-releasing ABC transporter permease subunit [Burkholderiales bacterium]